ncbi:hypothetical protein GCM10009609_10260 [Pseudonocardia aurantiaca]
MQHTTPLATAPDESSTARPHSPMLIGGRTVQRHPRGLGMTVLAGEARALFAGPNIAHVATLLPDGGPHSVPVMM